MQGQRRQPRLLFAVLTVCVIASAALLAYALANRPGATGDEAGAIAVVEQERSAFRGGALPEGLGGSPAPDFRLRDARSGALVGPRDVAGKPYVVTFLYVQCPDVCPVIGAQLRQAIELLGPRGDDVAVLGVSADPAGDTRDGARAWLDSHRLPANFHYLLGERGDLKPVWDAYFSAPQGPDRELSSHSASMWLVDGGGRIRTKFSAGAPVPAKDIAHDLRLLLGEAGGRG